MFSDMQGAVRSAIVQGAEQAMEDTQQHKELNP